MTEAEENAIGKVDNLLEMIRVASREIKLGEEPAEAKKRIGQAGIWCGQAVDAIDEWEQIREDDEDAGIRD